MCTAYHSLDRSRGLVGGRAGLSTSFRRAATVLGDQRLQNTGDLFEDIAGRAIAANLVIIGVLIMREYRTALVEIGLQAVRHNVFLVICACDQRRAIVIAESGSLGGLMEQIVDGSASGTLAAVGQSADQGIERNVEMQDDGL